MYDPRRDWSLSFSGCGFLGFYYIGVTSCLSERAPHLLRDARMFFGSSAGALHCVTFLAGIPLDKIVHVLMGLVYAARRRNIGIFHPSFRATSYIREHLRRHLPANVHTLVSGRMCVSLTRVSDGESVLVSDFQSKDEVVDALVCSSFIPFYCGLIPPSFRGVRYVDGGITNNIPFFDSKTTITVSPFFGEYDICPKVKSTNFLHVELTTLSLRLCPENVYLLIRALFPPDLKVLGEICLRGYLDATRFLEENGICSGPRPGLSLSPEEWGFLVPPSEHTRPGSPPRAAAWGTKMEGDELLDHLRVSILPWDESILETLPPRLTTALSEAVKSRQRCMSNICNSLPVKILSFAMLPCTLPVESAVAVVQRLVTWLPDIPEDIRWLQWITLHTCSRVVTHLFPTHQTPGAGKQPAAFPGEREGVSSLLAP
ncbi:1-acylglycerol-3-phosphate O-acyltransferase PNPLA3 [Leopardus geoffroyi]|uniref:1-acylglycerol-3-phosphate O-acyltransferase PNPLA3 n=1 Tax=Leopardus geoffroyi TaxID=46844 RepID=UPI001E2609CA|nr:1-acylglycerol-3-phosphate O-acyltransferase PNPLA3 [Leopardus geoffroyi]